MKHTVLKILLAATAVFCASFAFAACSDGGTNSKVYDYLVTFDYNVGDNEESSIINQYVGVAKNSLLVIKPVSNSNTLAEQTLQGYYNEGWYTAKTDSDGNPVKDENGKVVLDRLWNFDSDRVNSDLTLYANFKVLPKLTIVVENGDDVVFSEIPGKTLNRPSATEPKKDGYTFAGYFTDSEFKTEFSWPYTFATEDHTIYAKFIEGNWTIVTTAEGFKNAVAARSNIYLDSDIDFSQAGWKDKSNFNAELNGNNHKITGINREWRGTRNESQFGLFETIGARAKIYDLIIENATVNFTASIPLIGGSYKVSLFAHSITEGAVLKNVTVTGSLTINKNNTNVDYYSVCSNGFTSWENCNFDITLIEN